MKSTDYLFQLVSARKKHGIKENSFYWVENPFLMEQSLYQINLLALISVKVSTCRKKD